MKQESKSSRKGRRAKYAAGESPTEVAKLAGCSRPLAYRLLRRGMTVAQIVERCRARKDQEATRAGGRAGKSNRDGNGFPPYSVSQAAKEYHLAELRALEVRSEDRR